MGDWVITTNRARCRDCYRCVRTCHVKAVRVQGGQAQIVPELCIACGSCVRACPQNAKSIRDDRPLVREALAAGRPVVATVAPSAPAFFGIQVFSQMEAALQGLGFQAVEETARGAEMVGLAHKELVETRPDLWPIITSSCPVVVNLVERYYPELIPHLSPIVSPMVAHGRALRARYGEEALVVFVGPCIAKKAEALDPAVAGAVDAALTFTELEEWLLEEEIHLPAATSLPEPTPRANARAFPVEGGLVGTANLSTDILASHIVTTSGLEACEDVLAGICAGQLGACMVELMACEGGCVNGPAMEGRLGTFLSRQRVLDFASRRQPQPLPRREEWPDLERSYSDQRTAQPEFTEEQILEVLRKVDKFSPEDELNCGACGYPTCRDKAVATLRGMAEATMCIPYMRRRAESLRQVVMEVTPNAVLIVDYQMIIQDLSPSAQRLLQRNGTTLRGKPLHMAVPDVSGFKQVRDSGRPLTEARLRLRDDLVVEQTVVPVEGQTLLVGILRDVTEREQQREELDHIRKETLSRTQEVVKNQMRVAHEIAQLLGETTAETKMALSQLARLLEEGKEP